MGSLEEWHMVFGSFWWRREPFEWEREMFLQLITLLETLQMHNNIVDSWI